MFFSNAINVSTKIFKNCLLFMSLSSKTIGQTFFDLSNNLSIVLLLQLTFQLSNDIFSRKVTNYQALEAKMTGGYFSTCATVCQHEGML